ncbi:hypothetical protein D7D81_07535 [Halocella sp. SP3-1]|nr:hypothetical protein D7D81_07535 [Halocella sp. SP3-1]
MEAQVELGTLASADIDEYEKENYKQITVYTNKNISNEMLAGKNIVLKKALGIFKKLILQG